MRFDKDDEEAFSARRDQLLEQFARWLGGEHVAGDPSHADLLLEWKFSDGDGFLDRWGVGDVEEFLLGWCPRQLSAPTQECADIPLSVAAFVDFLDSTGLLAGGSDSPAQVRDFCVKNTKKFMREMGNPANFGMAKSMFDGFDEIFDEIFHEDDEIFAEDDEELPVVGLVRLPTEQEQEDAVRAASVPRQLRLLWEYCAPPGRPLTGKGNLRLADARHLVAALETGDDPELGGHRKLSSAEDLPVLSWLLELALAAGVVRRTKGRLMAVARFADLDEAAAYRKVVRAAVAAGLSPTPYWSFPALELARAEANEAVVGLLAELLDAGAEAVPRDDLVEIMTEMLEDVTFGMPPLVEQSIPGMVLTQVERLAALGMVTVDAGQVALTAAGVPVAAELVRDAGIGVLLRPDPETADAGTIADLLGVEDVQEWVEDASAWLAAQPDRDTALEALVDEVCGADREQAAVLTGVIAIGTLVGEQAVSVVGRQVGGPHDGLVLNWLARQPSFDPSPIDPFRFVSGLVDVLAVVIDLGGPQEIVDFFDQGTREQQLDLLDHIWQLDHPRLADVLEAVGAHHPVEAVAEAARRSLIQHRSWLARPSDQRS